MKIPFWPCQAKSNFIDLDLSRIKKLLFRLGNPHLKLPQVIHLAGTNGKGSTLSFLRSILQESDLKVHCYTSPHLVNFNERIILSNQEISDEFLNEILQKCQKACEQDPKIDITYFEGITAAAFLAFSEVKADILLLETGMGGRFDATNVLDQVLCSIITPIALDHQEFLGNSIDKIAFEKAGIFKENCPVIIAKQEPEALEILKIEAKKKQCETIIYGQDFDNKLVKINNLPLAGNHQIENAATAIIAAKIVQNKLNITNLKIEEGLQKTKWPARLEKIANGKLFNLLPKNSNLYLDGGHNLQCAKTIKEFLKKITGKKIIIFSIMKDKDASAFLNEIKDEISQIFILNIANNDRSFAKEKLVEIANNLSIKAEGKNNFKEIFNEITSPTNIMICGSLYLAGEFLEENQ